MRTIFSLENGDLIIKDVSSQNIIWGGKPLNCSVENMIIDEINERCFVLLSKGDGPRLYPGGPLKAFRNLICMNTSGEIIWRADLPGSGIDYYTSIIWAKDLQTNIFDIKLEFEPNSLIALSFSGFLVNINPENGKFISQLLIK